MNDKRSFSFLGKNKSQSQKNHWEILNHMEQIVKMDILRQDESIQKKLAIRKKKETSNANEVAELFKIVQIELSEVSKNEAGEISKVTEENVRAMITKEDEINKIFQKEFSLLEKQLQGNSPTKTKICQKLNEKKAKTIAEEKQKLEEDKKKQIYEINEKYNKIRSEKLVKTNQAALQFYTANTKYSTKKELIESTSVPSTSPNIPKNQLNSFANKQEPY